MAKKRAPKLELTEEQREYFRQQGAIGGKKAAKILTKAQRSAKAKKAVDAREAKRKKDGGAE